jgi:hypothetical protein
MEKKITHQKKKFVPAAFKFMVAVGSLAGTVGIWNILANKDLLQASAQNTDPTSAAPTAQQPMPTVAPLMSVDLNSQNLIATTQSTLTVRDVTITTSNQNSSAASSSSAGITTFSAPAPITVTQTSKKP